MTEMTEPFAIAFFGLPLAACLLHGDGHHLTFAALPALEGLPGRRRLARLLGPSRVLDVSRLGDAFDASVTQRLAEHRPDLIVSWFWPRRLPTAWLGVPRLGAIGAHPSLLPRHRGPNPYFWAIDEGDPITGASIHYLTQEYDEGAVLLTAEIATGQRNAWQLARALDRPSLRALRAVVSHFSRGVPPQPTPQDPALATWAPEPSGNLLRVIWAWDTERVLRRIRALSPVPALAIEVRGIPLFVTSARAAQSYPKALLPGEAATLGLPPTELVIRTGDGAISVERATRSTEAEGDSGQDLNASEVAALVSAAGMVDCGPPEGNG